MKLTLRYYDAVGFQDALPGEENPSMPVQFLEAEVSNGETSYTLGRLFFPPDIFTTLVGEEVELELVDERRDRERVTTA